MEKRRFEWQPFVPAVYFTPSRGFPPAGSRFSFHGVPVVRLGIYLRSIYLKSSRATSTGNVSEWFSNFCSTENLHFGNGVSVESF